jgi:hypothetical protein
MTIKEGDSGYDRLYQLWDGNAQYVDDGGMTYRVYLPNGREHPVFSSMQDQMMYGSTSTSKLAPEPKTNKPKQQKTTTKNTDLGS